MEKDNTPFCSKFFSALFRKKKIVSDPDSLLKTPLKRCLDTFDITLIGIGTTLGSGVYILTGEISHNMAGPAIVISYLLAAIASILSGLCYAEFAARVPKAGSAYVYSYSVMGEFFGFTIGWNLLLEYGIGSAASIRGFSSYLNSVCDGYIKNTTIDVVGKIDIFGNHYLDLFSFFFTLLITFLLSFGVNISANVNSLCTCVNLIVIIMVISMGAFYAKPRNITNFAPFGIQGIITGASSCFFAFIGFDAVCTVAEEAKEPRKSIPIAVISTIAFCFIGYFGVSIVLNMMVPYSDLIADAALSQAFKQVGNHPAQYIIGCGALFGLVGNCIVSIMMMPRFLYSMSTDGLVFHYFSQVNRRSNVPLVATVSSGLLVATMSLLLSLKDLVEMTSIGTLLAYTLVTISVLKLRYSIKSVGLVLDDDTKENSDVLEQAAAALTPNVQTITPVEDTISSTGSVDRISFYSDSKTELVSLATPINSMTTYPTQTTEKHAIILIFILICELFAVCGILHFAVDDLANGSAVVITLFSVNVFFILLTAYALNTLPQNPKKLHFKVPWLPWLPVMALFLNIYLLYGLNKLTWLRFAVWMVIGFAIYFGYGVWHSEERFRSASTEDQ